MHSVYIDFMKYDSNRVLETIRIGDDRAFNFVDQDCLHCMIVLSKIVPIVSKHLIDTIGHILAHVAEINIDKYDLVGCDEEYWHDFISVIDIDEVMCKYINYKWIIRKGD